MRKIFLFSVLLLSALLIKADEGMWLLKELNKQSFARMQELGFSFPTDSIYSETNPSLKDAVVIFGRGCTGVAVSEKGLIFTNHHCGYGDIQKLSSVEHDYLKDGFVSQSFSEELPAEGLTVSFLQKTEDVTDFVTSTLSPDDDESTRDQKIDSLSNICIEKSKINEFIRAEVVPFYSHNKYYLVVYEVFKDVRLVFTPPSSIGKFGGETDNWMWPRHTGDFSVFRVYANKDNKAANYSPDNVPYSPKYSVPVSVQGFKDKDYAMTIGYPGSTERYMSSWGINQMVESQHKPRIEVRGAKQEIWKKAMNASDAVRIKYASKYAGSSNYWKNAMGMNEAIAKLGVIKNKEDLETKFGEWISASGKSAKYGEVLPMLKEGYTSTMRTSEIQTYLFETFYNGIEMVRFANTALFVNKMDEADKAEELRARMTNAYKDYEPSLDRKVMPVLLKLYAERVPAEYRPAIYETINKKFKGDYDKYADWFFKNTKLTTLDGVVALISNGKAKDVDKDPAIELSKALEPCLKLLQKEAGEYYTQIDKGERLFMAGLMEMEPDKTFSPDANFTQRLSYGSIGGYKPADAVTYDYYSTSKGVLEKENPNDPEFAVQQYILNDLKGGDFGQYADTDGKMHVNFLSNNDITGGNSGSPVFNGKAQLIGLAFDGNWEALSGDIVFEPEVQRTISVDIRYVLYTIDKVMKCPRLIEELKIIK
ncbi:S46 family peptidase [Dysgonomonas sp. Marseille-P4677]|uniref:S46 family peptidase n=1 Tax=Dysgonomonas sp. Marseille-P4677 TaxID=2364790 RepID=UPI0019149B64|nr:S46 family peptidase [Dysgonomonas sp. Marseille-P4677]MBK5720163.1 S46 family peptidase [Dysgonomonas sp. Marseille-P4677]